MNRLLRLKHWQLFILMVGIPLILQFFFAAALAMSDDSMRVYSVIPSVMFLFIAIFFGWLYAIGKNLHKMLPASVKMNLTKFKVFISIPITCILFICIFSFFIFKNTPTNQEDLSREMVLIILYLFIPLCLFSVFCIFYCFYFNAKALRAIELQRQVTFGDFTTEVILFYFYPIGVWVIQPRINKLFEKNNPISSDL